MFKTYNILIWEISYFIYLTLNFLLGRKVPALSLLNFYGMYSGFIQFIAYLHCCYCSVAQSCVTICNPMDSSIPGFPVLHLSWSLLKLMSVELVMPSNHLILCRPLLLLPSVFPSIRVCSFFFSNESVLPIRWA